MIKDIPNCDKPREKALKYGVNNLSDSELIAIILRTGTVNYSVIDIAQNILRESNTINKLNQLSISKLSEIRGVGKVKAITLMAAIELGRRSYQTAENIPLKIKSAVVVFEYFKYIFLNQKQENFIVIFLDNQKMMINYKTIFIGSLNYLSVHPREIFKSALLESCAGIILVHNHPSGDENPSVADKKTTEQMIKIGNLLQIPVIDHIIIAQNKYYSFYDNGLIK